VINLFELAPFPAVFACVLEGSMEREMPVRACDNQIESSQTVIQIFMKAKWFCPVRAALAVLLSSAVSVESQDAKPAPLSNVTVTTRAVDSRAAEQLLTAYDAGDSYPSATGRRSLHRLAGAVAVWVEENTNAMKTIHSLTNAGGALAGYEHVVRSKVGFGWLRAGPGERQLHLKNHVANNATIAAAKAAPGVRVANPVFVDPVSGLWVMTTDEIIVALKPGVIAPTYFGADWPRVRALFAPGGQYILSLTNA